MPRSPRPARALTVLGAAVVISATVVGVRSGDLPVRPTTAAGAISATGSLTETRALTTSAGASLRLHGRLVVVASERPNGKPEYGVALADGRIVTVTGHLAPDVRTGDVFDSQVLVPESVTRTLAGRSVSGSAAALRVADRRDLPLATIGTPSITESTTQTAGGSAGIVHRQYVAALDNEGTLDGTDAQLLDHVATVAAYWQTQANGAISRIDTPAAITHFNTTHTGLSCGVGVGAGSTAYFDIVEEAMAQFPGIDPFGGTDQLVLFVPSSCSSTDGTGSVGTSFATGGSVVLRASPTAVSTLAHETGHNFGFAHANARGAGGWLEYYGLYDVMSGAVPGFDERTALSTPLRVYQGITDAGEIRDVDLGAGLEPVHETVTVRPRTEGSGIRSVRVTDPDTDETLYLDYRSGTGQDAQAAYVRRIGINTAIGALRYAPGVTVEAARPTGGVDTLVVDIAGDTSLGQSMSWSSAGGRLTVTVGAVTATGAEVTVDYRPAP